MLSLIVIENNIHEYIVLNSKEYTSHDEQMFQEYINTVQAMSLTCGSTIQLAEQYKSQIEKDE